MRNLLVGLWVLWLWIILFLPVYAADLLDVYQQAEGHDPIYRAAIATCLSNMQAVPIAVSALLPSLTMQMDSSIRHSRHPRDHLQTDSQFTKMLGLHFSIHQSLFDFVKFYAIDSAQALSKQSRATLNAILQDLMVRVAHAYLIVLHDQEILHYKQSARVAYAKRLIEAKQQYHAGSNTLTDIHIAMTEHDLATAEVIAAETTLANDREKLRVITGTWFMHFAVLRDSYPLSVPQPMDVKQWLEIALEQNWEIKAKQYAVIAYRKAVSQQFAGHFPVLTLEGNYSQIRSDRPGSHPVRITELDREIGLQLVLPIFSGGEVVARTKQAIYQYQAAKEGLQQTIREVMSRTRQNYRGMLTEIVKIKADKQAIQSAMRSLQGMEAKYQAGVSTLSDVLLRQRDLLKAQTQYASDRYAYINALLALQQAAGTLSVTTLSTLNTWLKK